VGFCGEGGGLRVVIWGVAGGEKQGSGSLNNAGWEGFFLVGGARVAGGGVTAGDPAQQTDTRGKTLWERSFQMAMSVARLNKTGAGRL